ncbi:MAG: chloride channel protein [Bacteroidales bacterium]|nr:chloride channel protein [Bacteroidales bacterium]
MAIEATKTNTSNWYTRLIDWRETHIKENHFLVVLSIVIGCLTALAAWALKSIVHVIQHLVTNISDSGLNYWYLILPAVGITIASLFVRYIVRDDIGHGVTKILAAISQHKSIIKPHNMWSSVVASAITIGFGGSVGAEAPIVLTGSAIGSNLGRICRLDQKTLMLLVGCGAAGAIGGIFKAPIAGVAFTLEVLMIDLTMTSLLPLLITSVTATSLSYLLTGNEALFHFDGYAPFAVDRIPFIIVLGIVCGMVSLYFTRCTIKLEGMFKKLRKPIWKLVVGSVILSVLIFFFPPLYGEGYEAIEALLSNNPNTLFEQSIFAPIQNNIWGIVLYLSLIVLFKVFATTATNGAGGTGGIFAPSLFVGCLTGFIVAEGLNIVGIDIPISNFAFAGMAGLMSGVLHAPLMSTFLIAELTGGYDLFITLIITSVVSYLTIVTFEPHSLYAMRLAQKGELLTHHKDRSVLTLMKMESVIETDLDVVYPEMTLGELVKVISLSKRNIFPVVNKTTGVLIGIVPLDEVRNIMFQPRLYNRFTVERLMLSAPAKINSNLPMEKVMDIFESTGAWNLPVVDDDGRYLGFVSKSKIFNTYRKVLVHFSEE